MTKKTNRLIVSEARCMLLWRSPKAMVLATSWGQAGPTQLTTGATRLRHQGVDAIVIAPPGSFVQGRVTRMVLHLTST